MALIENYCNYYNPKWVEKVSKFKSPDYKIKIQGNTLYILYKNNIFNFLFRKIYGFNNEFEHICLVGMQEEELIDYLRRRGFNAI